jgi:hypothetical protein
MCLGAAGAARLVALEGLLAVRVDAHAGHPVPPCALLVALPHLEFLKLGQEQFVSHFLRHDIEYGVLSTNRLNGLLSTVQSCYLPISDSHHTKTFFMPCLLDINHANTKTEIKS